MSGKRALKLLMRSAIWLAGTLFVIAVFFLSYNKASANTVPEAAPFPLSVNAAFAEKASIKTIRAAVSAEQAVNPALPSAVFSSLSSAVTYSSTISLSPSSSAQTSEVPQASQTPAPASTPVPYPHYGVDEEEGLWYYRDEETEIYIERRTGEAEWGIFTAYVADVYLKNMGAMTALLSDEHGQEAEFADVMSARANAVLSINGDFYDFRADGIIVRNGEILRERPAREMLAIYNDGSMAIHNENNFDAQAALSEGLMHTYSFGPGLVRVGAMPERYVSPVSKPNPRTAVGMIEPGHFIFVVVDGRMDGYSHGMSMLDLGRFMYGLGCVEAYNLDGGASSEMCFMGKTINRPSDGGRQTSDILCITSSYDLQFG